MADKGKRNRKNKRENQWAREGQSNLYVEERLTSDFKMFVRQQLLPRLKIKGLKRAEKMRIATHCLHCLICAGLMGKTVADSRNNAGPNALRIQVWDAIIAAGMAEMALGSESSKKVTRYFPASWLIDLREHWELNQLCDINLARNTELDEATRFALVVFHSGKVDFLTGEPLPKEEQKKPLSIRERIEATCQRDKNDIRNPDSQAVQNGLEYFRQIEDAIESINANNLEHTWVAKGETPGVDGKGRRVSFQPNVCLRQVHSEKLFRCVRLYSWGGLSAQNMTKAQRRTLLIDGAPCVELDFSGYMTRMLYHLQSLDPKGDVYHPDKVFPKFYSFKNVSLSRKKKVRDLVKRATNVCWNTDSRSVAVGAVKGMLDESPKELKNVVYNVEGSGASDLLKRIEAVHPKLKDRFYSMVGVDLMTADGNVMKHILLRFVEAKKPVLGIHDSLVVKQEDAEFAEDAMNEVYEQFFPGHHPEINRVE